MEQSKFFDFLKNNEKKIIEFDAKLTQLKMEQSKGGIDKAAIYYQLTYFNTGLNQREKYLNGTSWETILEAENEYILIKSVERQRRKSLFYSHRTKWAIEAVSNKDRIIVEMCSSITKRPKRIKK